MRVVNVRELKDKLSAHLRAVGRGEVFLVTDRGRVVAELRKPSIGADAARELTPGRTRLIDAGILRPGLPHEPAVYDAEPVVSLSAEAIDAALDATRGDR